MDIIPTEVNDSNTAEISNAGEEAVLQVEDITVRYGDFTAVSGVSFSVRPGEIFGLLGPNGAGKTSTISVIETLQKQDAGQVVIMGMDTLEQPLQCKANMGVQLQSTSFQAELQVKEIIRLFAGLYGMKYNGGDVQAALEEIKLENAGNKLFAQLSGGQQQRLSLYLSTMHNPPLVILDEPTTGLDPQSRRQLWERIEGMRDKGHSVLLTTHSMEEAELLCDRICIIDHGKVVTSGDPMQIIKHYSTDPEVMQAARRGRVTLEDVFIVLTGKAIRE